jgi:nicotinamide mononucleotide transporter
MNPIEVVAAVIGLVSVVLAARQNIWNFPLAFVMVSIYVYLCYQAKLYADMGLQFVYMGLQAYGVWEWKFGGSGHSTLRVSRTTPREWLAVVIFVAIAFPTMSTLLDRYTDTDVAYWDSLVTVMSLCAQWMLSRKKIENWPIWIVTNILYIPLWLHKHMIPTALLYTLFIGVDAAGFLAWRKALRSAAQ